MRKEQETKIMTCLYIIIALLFLNTICTFISLSKNDSKSSNTTTSSTNDSTENVYDASMFTKLSPSEVTKKIKNGDLFILYIGRSGCTYCQKMLPTLQQAQKEYNYTTVYIDTDSVNISSNEYKEMASLLDVIITANGETQKFGEFQVTPMVAILNNGKMVDGMIGYNTYENFTKFLEDAGVSKK